MSRARYNQDTWQTAAAYESQGSGCLSGFFIPPLMVLLVGSLLAFFAFTTPAQSIPMQTSRPRLGSALPGLHP